MEDFSRPYRRMCNRNVRTQLFSDFTTHSNKSRDIILFLILAIAVQCSPGQSQDSGRVALAAKLDSYLSRAAAFGFSGVVLVSRHGKTVLQQGYGLADRSNGIPFTPETAFDIGSVAKQFTAAAILKLEMGGKLTTSDRIGKYLDGVPIDKADITLQQLLSHTSGLPRDYANKNSRVSRDYMIAGVLSTRLISKPGEQFSYSNAGYVLLAAIIERASGQSFYSYMHEALFTPLGMLKTGFYNEKERWSSNELAHSYYETAEEGVSTEWPLTWSATGNGHVISTMGDLLKWELSLRDYSLLSQDEVQKLFAPRVRVDSSTSYCSGWFAKQRSGETFFFHPGFYRSFGTEYRRYPDKDIAIIVSTNQGYADGHGMQDPVCDPISGIALGKNATSLPPVISVSPEALHKFEGNYKLDSLGQFVTYVQSGGLKIEMSGQNALNAFFPNSPRPEEAIRLNRQAAVMVEATWKGDRTRLEQTLSQPDYAAYVSSMDSGWSALAKQFGPLESYDILGTGPYPFTEEYIRTYARLNFEREFVIVTFGYRRGGFFDLSTWENVPNPGALPFAPISENEFETYNLWTSRTSRVVFDISADGTVSGFQVLSSGRRLFAKKIR